jgi:DNA-binding CsgD family transcriptional regulator
MRLSHKDFEALQQAILELYELRNLQAFHQMLPRIALKIIPADYCNWSNITLGAEPKITHEMESVPLLTPPIRACSVRNILSHPFTMYFTRTKDVTAVKLTDLMNLQQLRSTWLWEVLLQPFNLKYELGVSTGAGRGAASAINLLNQSKDFTERDRLMLNLLRPHIVQAGRTAELITALQNVQPSPAVSPDGLNQTCRLTPREREVARWVVEGKSNPEIGIILQASPRTIEKHMENILVKLGAENRTTAATQLLRGNLLVSQYMPPLRAA